MYHVGESYRISVQPSQNKALKGEFGRIHSRQYSFTKHAALKNRWRHEGCLPRTSVSTRTLEVGYFANNTLNIEAWVWCNFVHGQSTFCHGFEKCPQMHRVTHIRAHGSLPVQLALTFFESSEDLWQSSYSGGIDRVFIWWAIVFIEGQGNTHWIRTLVWEDPSNQYDWYCVVVRSGLLWWRCHRNQKPRKYRSISQDHCRALGV